MEQQKNETQEVYVRSSVLKIIFSPNECIQIPVYHLKEIIDKTLNATSPDLEAKFL